MKNIIVLFFQVCLFASLCKCTTLDYDEISFLPIPRFNETCESMENAKLCEDNCKQLYQLCLEKYSDETICNREFFMCIDGRS